ncbi:MAG TPA: hypothetical protein VGP82_02515 [Ktedonobacterales bacterium]|nr:hypothetical protein [Ktedonobacterales bacterium]
MRGTHLGHGDCTYDFFDQCPHRIACAKCSFYRPKGSSEAQLLEARANLLRMRQEIPLTDEERDAVDDGIAAMEAMKTLVRSLLTSRRQMVALAAVRRVDQASCAACAYAHR